MDAYNAAISGAFTGGGQLNAHFNLAAGSTITANQLTWVQLVTTTDPANPPGASPYLDVFASGYTVANGYANFLPFYYRPDETTLDNAAGLETGNSGIRSSSYTIGGNNYDYDIAFDDFSQRTYTDHTIDWTGDLFLAGWSGPLATPGMNGYGATTLTIYDGIQWGWEITPVPAPLIGRGLPVVLAVGGLLFAAEVLQRNKKRRSLGTSVPRADMLQTG